MKNLVLLAALLVSVNTFAGNGPKLVKEIRNKAIINLNRVKLNEKHQDFVAVKFTIKEKEIMILNINGSQEVLKERVQEKLESLTINSDYEENKKYVIKFKFEEE